MDYRVAIWLIGLLGSGAVHAAEYLERVESQVIEVPGASVRDLTERARICVSQLVTYGDVVIRDSARVSHVSPVPGSVAGDTTAVAGGDVIRTVDLDTGLLVAQSRVPVTSMLMKYSVESTITFEAREGRFKITQTGIRAAQEYTGYAANTGYQPVGLWTGSPWKKVEAALQKLASKIGDCVATAENSDW